VLDGVREQIVNFSVALAELERRHELQDIEVAAMAEQ